jgi:anti-anti-sigma factor
METDFFGAAGNSRAPALVHESRDDAEVLHVFGELDFAANSDFESALAHSVGLGRVLVVDLTPCTYIEACALGVLTRARIALGDLLRVEVADGSIVHRVFEIAALPHRAVLDPAFRPTFISRLAPRAPGGELDARDLPADGLASA